MLRGGVGAVRPPGATLRVSRYASTMSSATAGSVAVSGQGIGLGMRPHGVKTSLTFYVNHGRVEVPRVEPDRTLIEELRERGLTGTKLACGEGGCGACTVTVSHWDKREGKVVHRALNSCLVPLAAMEGMHITTTEGLGTATKTSSQVHPIQKQMAELFGSQCGFCTPGFVMSLHSALASNPQASEAELEKTLDGNLCRCTGYRPIMDAVKSLASSKDRVSNSQTNSLPAELTNYQDEPLVFQGTRATWYRPTSLADLLEAKAQHPEAKIVAGNTEIGIEQRFLNKHYPYLISPSHVNELNEIRTDCALEGKPALEIGAAVNLSDIRAFFQKLADSFQGESVHKRRILDAALAQLFWFSGTSIRNAACLGGNIVTASPISDLNPLWVAVGAQFKLKSHKGGERIVPASEFFLKGYRQVALKPDEVLVSVIIPFAGPDQYVEAYKQARRREDDIAIVNAAFSVQFDKSGKVLEAHLSFGGMAPSTVSTSATEQYLKGKEWSQQTFDEACKLLRSELSMQDGTPGGMEEFRTTLAQSMFYRFFLLVAQKRNIQDIVAAPEWAALESAIEPLPFHLPSKGVQTVAAPHPGKKVVGKNQVHMAATKQVTGEAVYADDSRILPNELMGALVMSKRPHAKIISVNAENALRIPGVRAFYSHKDVPGDNKIGDIVADEEVFASKEVHFVGEPIGIIVADNEIAAKQAAALVDVQYEDLPPVYTIRDAVQKGSFFPNIHTIESGNVDTVLRDPICTGVGVVAGEIMIGGQEHFYFEPHASIAYPSEGEMHIISSSQNLNKTQMFVASALGVPANKVYTMIKRIGGGFGGKETDNIKFACGAAVAAYHSNCPVRLVLARDVDMSITGKRHPFQGKYKVGFAPDGKIQAAEIQLYSNGGAFHDLSWPVMDRALFHLDNAYHWPNMRVKGQICRTNIASNTAFRGFGGPQGMAVSETCIEHVADELGMHPDDVRKRNLYKYDDKTHYGQQVKVKIEDIWAECERSSDYMNRRKEIEAFNKAHRYRKRGITMIPSKFGLAFTATFMNQGSALINIYTDGSVLVTHGGVEMGQGLHTKVCQVVAEELGVDINKVHVSSTGTDRIPNASPTAASMGSDLYCQAALEACQQINSNLAPLRAKMPNAPFKEIAKAAYYSRINLAAQSFYKSPVGGYNFETREGNPFLYFTTGVAATEVEVDTLTGDYRALRSDLVMDLGRSMNPAIDIGQIEGAFVQGQGWSTMEELVWGDEDHKWVRPGHLRTNGPGAYKIPSADDIPRDLRVTLMKDIDNPVAVHSSRAVGEPPLFMGASVFYAIKRAIAAARKDAGLPGFYPMDMPASCERIRMACYDRFIAGIGYDAHRDLTKFRAKGSF